MKILEKERVEKTSKKCNECGTELEPNADFCIECGTKITRKEKQVEKTSKKCNECGTELEPNADFCIECGTKITRKEKQVKVVGRGGKVKDFVETLQENVEGYSGVHSEIIQHSPRIFGLFQNLSERKDLDPSVRELVDSVVTYFVLPHDALPEAELGPFGYVDDLYLCAYVINELKDREKIRRIIWDCWDDYRDVFRISSQILEEVENSSKDSVNEVLLEEVLNRVGLKKREKSPRAIEEKIEMREREPKVEPEPSIEKEKVCSRCGKELPTTAHSWTEYCDDCAKVVYESSESIVDDIKWVLSDMGGQKKPKTSVSKAIDGSLKTEALERLKGFVSEVLVGNISHSGDSSGFLNCSHLSKNQANMLKQTMGNLIENTGFNEKIAVRGVNLDDEQKRQIEIELLVSSEKLPNKRVLDDAKISDLNTHIVSEVLKKPP